MNKDFNYYLSKFLSDYLIIERNLSPNTIKSYKKTFQFLIEYLVKVKHFKLNEITFKNITREIIIDFLNSLEEKGNSIQTRNQRLGAIKSFYQFCLIDEIENIDNINKILTIKAKKFTKKVIDFLTEDELKQVFDSIDISTKIGRRNLTILVLLYDTGARVSEIINLKVEDIHLEEKYVILTGKGNKQRVVPIMENTKKLLINYFKENKEKLWNNDFTYEGIRYIFKKIKLILNKNITPHTFRHSRAIHLLDNGVNIMYIKEFLGHECISTTQEYAKVIEKSKFDAIKMASPNINNDTLKDWNDDHDLLNLLLNL